MPASNELDRKLKNALADDDAGAELVTILNNAVTISSTSRVLEQKLTAALCSVSASREFIQQLKDGLMVTASQELIWRMTSALGPQMSAELKTLLEAI